jgi:predicted Fe-Mo cluster-binding NifX family protein
MKIAISAGGNSMQSPFEPRFGRSPGFLIYDTETGKDYYIDNSTNQGAAQGAGIQTAQIIADHGVQILITGPIGPKASAALAKTNINIFNCSAQTVAQALEIFQSQQAKSSKDNFQQTYTDSGSDLGSDPSKGGRGPGQGGRGMGGGARGRGPGQGGRGMGGGGQGKKGF